jgi:hypothetical protein
MLRLCLTDRIYSSRYDETGLLTAGWAQSTQCPGIKPQSITSVMPMTMMLVAQAITFHSREFLYARPSGPGG